MNSLQLGVREINRPDLKRCAPTKKRAIALAQALAVAEELDQSACCVHYKPPHMLDLPCASPKDRVLEYLDSRLQEDQFIPSRDVFKTEDLEQKYHLERKTETEVKSAEPDCKPEVSFPSRPNPNTPALSPAIISWVRTMNS